LKKQKEKGEKMRSVETLESVLARPACLLSSVSDMRKRKKRGKRSLQGLKKHCRISNHNAGYMYIPVKPHTNVILNHFTFISLPPVS